MENEKYCLHKFAMTFTLRVDENGRNVEEAFMNYLQRMYEEAQNPSWNISQWLRNETKLLSHIQYEELREECSVCQEIREEEE